jgi:hypothetical protein
MRLRSLIAGVTALACLAGAAVTFLWQGIRWLQSETWLKVSLATALRWLDGRAWARLAHTWPDGLAFLDSIPLSLALLGLAAIGYLVVKLGSDR